MKIFVIFISCQIKKWTQFICRDEHWVSGSLASGWLCFPCMVNVRSWTYYLASSVAYLPSGKTAWSVDWLQQENPTLLISESIKKTLSQNFSCSVSDSVWDVSYISETTYNNTHVGGSLTSFSGAKIILPTTCCNLWYRNCHKSTYKMLVKMEHFCQKMSGCTILNFLRAM